VARSLGQRFPDGVWLAELAGLAKPDLVGLDLTVQPR